MTDAIEPFRYIVPDGAIADLHARIDATRWPEAQTVDDWSQGVPLAMLREFVETWRHDYDWRPTEAWINAQGLSTTTIDGVAIRFLHVRSPRADAVPLILTHGWPGSILEFRGVLGALTDPADGSPAFHCVVPCLPGYGLSGKPATKGWGVDAIARAWGTLMARLGYARWFAQGGDWGAVVTTQIGRMNVAGCAGIHLNMPVARPLPEDLANPTRAGRAAALSAMGFGLFHPATHAAPDRGIQPGRQPRRPGRVDLRKDVGLDRQPGPPRRRVEPRGDHRQPDAVLADRQRCVVGATLLGKLWQLCPVRHHDARGVQQFSQGNPACAAQMGRTPLHQSGPLGRNAQRRALCRVGTAGPVCGRVAHGVCLDGVKTRAACVGGACKRLI